MPGIFKRSLSKGEVAGMLIFVGGLAVITARQFLSAIWVPIGVIIMAVGIFVASRRPNKR